MVEGREGENAELSEVRHRLVTTLPHLLPPHPFSSLPPSLPPSHPLSVSPSLPPCSHPCTCKQLHTLPGTYAICTFLCSPENVHGVRFIGSLMEATSSHWASCSDPLLVVVRPKSTGPSGLRRFLAHILKMTQGMCQFLCLCLCPPPFSQMIPSCCLCRLIIRIMTLPWCSVFTASGDLKDFHFKGQKSLAAGRPLMPCSLAPDSGMYRLHFSSPAEACALSAGFGKEHHTKRSYTMTLSMPHFWCCVFHVADE